MRIVEFPNVECVQDHAFDADTRHGAALDTSGTPAGGFRP